MKPDVCPRRRCFLSSSSISSQNIVPSYSYTCQANVLYRTGLPLPLPPMQHSLLSATKSTHDHTLQSSHVTFLGGNLKVSVDDAEMAQLAQLESQTCDNAETYVTASKIPVPLPSAPIKSLITLRAPIQAPPKAAAVGMTLLSSLYIL